MQKRATLLATLAVATLVGCPMDLGGGHYCDAFYLVPNHATIRVGDSLQVSSKREGIDALYGVCRTVQDPPGVFIWTSNQPQVATVDLTALVRGIAPGSTLITALGQGGYADGQRATMDVTVTP